MCSYKKLKHHCKTINFIVPLHSYFGGLQCVEWKFSAGSRCTGPLFTPTSAIKKSKLTSLVTGTPWVGQRKPMVYCMTLYVTVWNNDVRTREKGRWMTFDRLCIFRCRRSDDISPNNYNFRFWVERLGLQWCWYFLFFCKQIFLS